MAPSPSTMPRTLAFLRSLNVGGNNRITMHDLARAFEQEGCTDVKTYIQSGNVAFSSADLADLPARIARRLREAHGLHTPVILRSQAELAEAATRCPFPEDTPGLHLCFLEAPGDERRIDPARSPADRFSLLGRDLYIAFGDGVARSKLTNAYIDRALGTTSTLRNWNTVRAMLALAGDGARR